MSYNADTNPSATVAVEFAKPTFAPLRKIDTFLQSIIAANRVAKEVENLSHASDRKLAELGLTRNEVAQYVARTSQEFRAL